MLDEGNQSEQQTCMLRLWTYEEAVEAFPYLCAVVNALREAWLNWGQARRTLRRVISASAKPGRVALIQREAMIREENRAESQFEETLQELVSLDVACLDPAQGLALIPFQQDGLLAWYLFDLFAPERLTSWRFHTDPIEVQRPLTAGQRLRAAIPNHRD